MDVDVDVDDNIHPSSTPFESPPLLVASRRLSFASSNRPIRLQTDTIPPPITLSPLGALQLSTQVNGQLSYRAPAANASNRLRRPSVLVTCPPPSHPSCVLFPSCPILSRRTSTSTSTGTNTQRKYPSELGPGAPRPPSPGSVFSPLSLAIESLDHTDQGRDRRRRAVTIAVTVTRIPQNFKPLPPSSTSIFLSYPFCPRIRPRPRPRLVLPSTNACVWLDTAVQARTESSPVHPFGYLPTASSNLPTQEPSRCSRLSPIRPRSSIQARNISSHRLLACPSTVSLDLPALPRTWHIRSG